MIENRGSIGRFSPMYDRDFVNSAFVASREGTGFAAQIIGQRVQVEEVVAVFYELPGGDIVDNLQTLNITLDQEVDGNKMWSVPIQAALGRNFTLPAY